MADNGWNEYKHLVTEWIARSERADERLADQIDTVNRNVNDLRSDIAALKVKATVWGALGGVIVAVPPMVAALLLFFLR